MRRALNSGLNERCAQALESIRAAGTFKHEQILKGPQGARVVLQGREKPVLNFASNNYLGLANHPKVIEAARSALNTHGFGLASVRFICGTQDIHKELEKKLAAFHQQEDCILYPSCFDANAGLFEALLGAEDAIISDALNHASIIDGVRLCKAQRYRYQHRDMVDLERRLQEAQAAGAAQILVVTDGVFSMDGNLAPLDEISSLCAKFGASLMVDECHGTGVVGPGGRGTPHLKGVPEGVALVNSTLGKALGGGTGGYTCGSREVVGLLRQKARPSLFSNSLAPSMAAAGLAALQVLEESKDELLPKLAQNVQLFRDEMGDAGFHVLGDPSHPICPVFLGDAQQCGKLSEALLAEGILAVAFSYPVVPHEKARIRVQLSASHSTQDVKRCVDAFVKAGLKLGIISV